MKDVFGKQAAMDAAVQQAAGRPLGPESRSEGQT